MTAHQINNVWDFVVIGFVWLIGIAYKAIAVFVIWFVSLFHVSLSFNLVNFNEWLHTIVLVLGGILTVAKLLPMAINWIKGNKKTSIRKFPKRKK